MKRLLVVFTVFLLVPTLCLADKQTFSAKEFVGGIDDCLDAISAETINDGDRAYVETSDGLYLYKFNAVSGIAESAPGVIQPKSEYSNALGEFDYTGEGRWILYRVYTKDPKKKASIKPRKKNKKNMIRHNKRWVSPAQIRATKRK